MASTSFFLRPSSCKYKYEASKSATKVPNQEDTYSHFVIWGLTCSSLTTIEGEDRTEVMLPIVPPFYTNLAPRSQLSQTSRLLFSCFVCSTVLLSQTRSAASGILPLILRASPIEQLFVMLYIILQIFSH